MLQIEVMKHLSYIWLSFSWLFIGLFIYFMAFASVLLLLASYLDL